MTEFNSLQRDFIVQRTAMIKREILLRVVLGDQSGKRAIPLNCDGFGWLDDNGFEPEMMGDLGSDDDFVNGTRLFMEPGVEYDGSPVAWQEATELVRSNVNQWLAHGLMRRNAATIACLDSDQVRWLLSERDGALDMLEDLQCRVLGRVPNFTLEDLELTRYLVTTVLFPAAE